MPRLAIALLYLNSFKNKQPGQSYFYETFEYMLVFTSTNAHKKRVRTNLFPPKRL